MWYNIFHQTPVIIYVSTNVFNIDDGPGLSIIGTADFLRKVDRVSDKKIITVYHSKRRARDVSNPITEEIRVSRQIEADW